MNRKVIDSSLFAHLVTIVNVVSLLKCSVHFWIELKACKWSFCSHLHSVSLWSSVISEFIT